MGGEIYISVLCLSWTDEAWSRPADMEGARARILEREGYPEDLINLHFYSSLRWDADIILWFSSRRPESFAEVKAAALGRGAGLIRASYSMMSIYEGSPYLRDGAKPEDTLTREPKKYFIAYPMSKTPDWYLIGFEERKEILQEHIRMAVQHPENKDIRSYTTYSFGIGDQEFVVMYETDSLLNWSHVTEKLREARARKWIVKETPIFLGSLIS
ncbi:chlorite dismutase [Thermogymnomonas acidicola]|uniref:Chlorite dismutase n=2 Tax=Thermogymnomonas acidicola TaxID=399579 RepID=A0AA37F9I7_9ARCH|nr:chlorite dismutase family protein [Thermogymnomonas acidicola]GGM74683.1 chlorite dismutase [Thermogymnomonas acidicola]